MIFYRAIIKATSTNGYVKVEAFSSVSLKSVREYAKYCAGSILKRAGFSCSGRYSIGLPFCKTCYFYNDEIVQVVIEKVEKITHKLNECDNLDEEYASVTCSEDLIKTNIIYTYAPGLWSTKNIL